MTLGTPERSSQSRLGGAEVGVVWTLPLPWRRIREHIKEVHQLP